MQKTPIGDSMEQIEAGVNQLLAQPQPPVYQPAPNQIQLNPPQTDPALFSMNQAGDMSLPSVSSFFKVKGGNVIVIALGVILSSTVGGFITRFLPSYSQYSIVIAGALIMYLGRRNAMLHDFGTGVFIAGLAQIFSGIGGMLGGMAGGTSMNNEMVSEDRVTYGGMDGQYPTQPERRTVR